METPHKILVAITGDPVASVIERRGDYGAIFRDAIGDAWAGAWDVVDLRRGGAPEVDARTAVVVTGSSSSVHEREPWMDDAERLLAAVVARSVPVLGVCYGHQMLAQALGGEVRRHPGGREISTTEIERVADDALLVGLGRRFRANACHKDTVAVLPPGAVVLAKNDHDPHQCVRFGPTAWGVQFHPEFDGEVMRGFVAARREEIVAEGLDYDALAAGAADTPYARRILHNFLAAR